MEMELCTSVSTWRSPWVYESNFFILTMKTGSATKMFSFIEYLARTILHWLVLDIRCYATTHRRLLFHSIKQYHHGARATFPDVPGAIRPTLHCIVDKICAFESRLQRSHRDDVKLLCQHLELRYSEYSSRFILTFSEQRWWKSNITKNASMLPVLGTPLRMPAPLISCTC